MDENVNVPEIRIRKSSETPSMGSTGDVPVMAPMASFETLTDVSDWEESEHGDDQGTDKQSEGEEVFNDSGQNNELSGSTGTLTEAGVEAGAASDSGLDKPSSLDVPSDEGDAAVTSANVKVTSPSKPERPPSPMLSPSSGQPPRRPPSPSRGPKRPPSPCKTPTGRRSPSPARPPPPKSKTPDERDDRELFELSDDEDNSYIEKKYGKELETKAIDRPRSTTPINIATLDSYVADDKDAEDSSEKITISLPGSKKSKQSKKHQEKEKQSQQDAAESWRSFNQDTQIFSKSPVQSGVVGPPASQAYQAAPVVEAAPESAKASWTTFGDDDDDEPQFQQQVKKAPPKRPPGPARPPPPKLSTRRSMDAIGMEERSDISAPPDNQNRRTSAPNAGKKQDINAKGSEFRLF